MARQIEGARTPNTSARAALIPAIVLLLVAACSASAETLTVDEYIAWCGGGAVEEDLRTWGDWTEALELVRDEARAISPPGELRGYHTASLEGLQIVIDSIEDKPADDAVDFLELEGSFERANGLIDTAVEKLPDDLRSRLDDVGCV